MTPTEATTMLPALTVETAAQAPSGTYAIDWEAGRVRGRVEGRAAMVQAIGKLLQTARFRYLIYSWNYGTEWDALLGKSRAVAESELRRVLEEALGQDGRITQVGEVTLSWPDRRTCRAAFTVETVFGTVREETNVYV